MGRRPPDGLDRHPAPLRCAVELAQAFHLPEDRARARPRHGQRLRRQAHATRPRSRPPGWPGGGQAGEAGLDPRRGVHLGLLPARRLDRDRGRRRQGRQADRLGVPQLQLRRLGAGDALQRAQLEGRLPRGGLASAAGLVPGTRRPRPTTSPASRSWTNWPMPRASTRWSSACGTWTSPGCGPCFEAPRRSSAGASRSPNRATASGSPAASRRADTSPPAPRSPSTRPPGRSRSSAPSPPSSAGRSSTPTS